MGKFEAKTTVNVMEIRFMFVSNQVRYLDHATLASKLNIIKKINQTKGL